MGRTCTALLVLALCAVAAPASAGARASRVRPRAFSSCRTLVGYERAHFAATRGIPELAPRPLSAPAIGAPVPSGVAVPQAAAGAAEATGAGSSFSTTNNQEPGVEEPDVVKTDGHTIFAVEQGTLYAVTVDGSAPRLAGSMSLGPGGYGSQLLLRGGRLLVISGNQNVAVGVALPALPAGARSGAATAAAIAHSALAPRPGSPATAIAPSPYSYPASSTVTELDVRNPAAMTIARTMTVEGTFVDARQNGGVARLVFSSAPRAIATPALRGAAAGWVPARRFHSLISGHRYSRPVASCSQVRRPAAFSGLGMLSIITINLDKGLYATDGTALMADAQLVYGSGSSLYVATQKWINPQTPLASVPSSLETVIDQFDATGSQHTPLVASGVVPGCLLNQFSMSEYHGLLRVASTSSPIWWNGSQPAASQSYVTVLANHGGNLVSVGQLAGLGAGEQIYSVRFIASAGYVVTFRRVDPLFTIDLSTPTAPTVAGKLELQGYSAYLHPISEGLLLGVGEEIGAGNEPTAAQLELFDVSSPASPRLLAHTSLGAGSSSQVQYDHHAFLFWPGTGLAVLPVSVYSLTPVTAAPPAPGAPSTGGTSPSVLSSTSEFVGAIGFHVGSSGISEVGRVTHDPLAGYTPQIDRSLVIGSRLFTLSSEGLMASNISTLAREAFVSFPAASSAPGGAVSSPPGALAAPGASAALAR